VKHAQDGTIIQLEVTVEQRGRACGSVYVTYVKGVPEKFKHIGK
jgi:hypothetical protein